MTASAQIDDLQYSYFDNSNKLKAVTEQGTGSTDHKLGDFTDKSNGTTDYGYDRNGNMLTDLNKRINGSTGVDLASGGGIQYNHLNLPWQINVKDDNNANKGGITYIYDATGNKLQKRTVEQASVANSNISTTTTTTYIKGFIYESKTDNNAQTVDYAHKLQFFGHEEGRVRALYANISAPATITGYAYDYMVKDHLGNVRMVLTEEQQQNIYPAATLENVTYSGGTAVSIEDDYYTINGANVVNQSVAGSN